MNNLTELPLLLSIDQAAAAIGLSRTIFYKRVMRGDIVSVKEGTRRLIPRGALQDYVDRRQAESSGQLTQEVPAKATVTA